jgi:uncharacterized protein YjbI with pentapeptide repeats
VRAVGQIRIRRASADLPVFDEDADLEPVSSLGADGGPVSGFEFGAASVRALDVKGVRLFDGKIRAVRAEHVSMTAVHVRSVEFTGCKLDYAVLDQVRAIGPVIFDHCSLREAEFTGCLLAGSLFDECDLSLAGRHAPPQVRHPRPRSVAAARRGACGGNGRDLQRGPA